MEMRLLLVVEPLRLRLPSRPALVDKALAPQPGGTGQPGGAAGQPGGGAPGPGGGVELPPIEPLPAFARAFFGPGNRSDWSGQNWQ